MSPLHDASKPTRRRVIPKEIAIGARRVGDVSLPAIFALGDDSEIYMISLGTQLEVGEWKKLPQIPSDAEYVRSISKS